MISLKDYLETVDYRVCEGSEYMWSCFGEHAWRFNAMDADGNNWSVEAIFDTRTQEVYEIAACDYARRLAYRWQSPEFAQAHADEAAEKLVRVDQAWDDVDFINLEVESDILEKAQSIVLNKKVDTRIQVPVELPDETMFSLMKLAHEQDITLNQLFENILRDEIERVRAS